MSISSLLLAAIRGAIVFGLVLLAMPVLRRASAATRRFVLVFAFGAVVMLPLATAVLPSVHVAPAAAEDPDTRALAAASSPEPIARAHAEPGATSSPAPAIASVAPAIDVADSPSTAALLLGLWAIGATAILARLGVGLWRARRLASGASLLEVVTTGSRSIDVRESGAIETPAVTGLFTPVILLPRDARTWTDERRRVVLQHELAHIARRDCLANAVAQVACALHWFNPLAWIAVRRLRIERELAADDLVLAAGSRASTYAEHLLELATSYAAARTIPAGALAMAERSQIAVRIRALLAAGRARAPLGRGRIAAFGAFGATVAVLLACATPDPMPVSEGPRDSTPTPTSEPSPRVQRRGGAPLDAIAPADLTIDPAVQAIAEDETDRLMSEWKPRAAVVIVLDPQNGHVLAMTSRSADAGIEIAVQRAYVPGSTVKPLFIAAALEEGVITPTQRFDTENGQRTYGGRSLRDTSAHGVLDAAGILEVSSNIGMTKIVDELGGARLTTWTKRFHFGEVAPVQLPNVASGAVPSTIEDRSLRGAEVAIGAGLTASPLQVAAAFSAIANGGIYHAPTLAKRSVVGTRVISEETSRTVMTMLEQVVTGQSGTGKAARVEGVRTAGKTGTAALAPDTGDYYASFVGAAPVDHPRYIVLVGAEAPRNHGAGGQVAAPVFSRIVQRALAR